MDYKRILETLIEFSDEGIIITDNKGNIVFYRESKKNLTGIENKKPEGKNILEVFPYLTESSSTFYNVLKYRNPIIDRVQKYKNHLGKEVTVITSTYPIIEQGVLKGAFEIFKDFTLVYDLSEKVVALQKQMTKGKEAKYKVLGAKFTFDDFIGNNPRIIDLKEKGKKISNSKSPILVYGETGTGKEILVQAIHNAGKRKNKPFIVQNCAALPHNLLESILFGTEEGSYTGAKDKIGLLEVAHGGTLYLDEINSMDLDLQGKLLRVIQGGEVRRLGSSKVKEVDIRIIASTNEKPEVLIENNKLRLDLYYRLNVIYFKIPPLRERKDDIELLAKYFLNKYNKEFDKNVLSISESLMKDFMTYDWPGNIRELQHVIESAMNWCEEPDINHKHVEMNFGDKKEQYKKNDMELFDCGLKENLEKYEKFLIESAIRQCDGVYAKAARKLQIPKQTLQNKIKKYKIKKIFSIEFSTKN
ncbi:sigma 54-interacting transcriptional regulator [Clostridium cadaveris]|uniref:sigma-54 interaction domain-containing protein n=1 Tax=Clostridium cadaveris TaxID=1529 RepID=UPI001459AF7C|nr:sigma 54-interacting transcriptional regulator [Clostridium cadaveris]NME64728.1 sigma 54-interacting transcriptional regulator [Clostridium cadaveris]